MKVANNYKILFFLMSAVAIWGCTEEDKSLDAPTIPSDVEMGIEISDDNSGLVTFAPTASNVLNFHLYPGDGSGPILIAPGESHDYIYAGLDDVEFVASIVAYGAGTGSSSATELIALFIELQIAPETLIALTGAETNSSKRWVWDSNVGGISGHLGVGPGPNLEGQDAGSYFVPAFFAADANLFDGGCLYDDVLMFTVNSDGTASFTLETNGETFINEQAILDLVPGGDTSAASCNAVDDQLELTSTWAVRPIEGANDLLTFGGGKLTPMSYYAAIAEYNIVELTPNKLRVQGFTPGGILAWYFQFVPE